MTPSVARHICKRSELLGARCAFHFTSEGAMISRTTKCAGILWHAHPYHGASIGGYEVWLPIRSNGNYWAVISWSKRWQRQESILLAHLVIRYQCECFAVHTKKAAHCCDAAPQKVHRSTRGHFVQAAYQLWPKNRNLKVPSIKDGKCGCNWDGSSAGGDPSVGARKRRSREGMKPSYMCK